jgi:hypothetical protein
VGFLLSVVRDGAISMTSWICNIAQASREIFLGNSQAAPHFWPPAVSAGGFQFGMIPVCSSFDSLLFGRSLRLPVLRAEKRAKKGGRLGSYRTGQIDSEVAVLAFASGSPSFRFRLRRHPRSARRDRSGRAKGGDVAPPSVHHLCECGRLDESLVRWTFLRTSGRRGRRTGND